VFEFIGFFSVIFKFTFKLVDEMVFIGKSNAIPLNVFVEDAAKVVLPIM